MLFRWRGIEIHAYPAMLYLGLVAGVLAGTFTAARRNLDPARVYVGLLLLVPAALVGARLLTVVSHWDFYRHRTRRIWRRSEGGAALYGGLAAAGLASLPLLPALRIPIAAFWDAATVTILTGMIFTKIGCLLNGCCAGRPTQGRIALFLPNAQGVWRRRVPAQLLEAALACALLLGASLAWNRLPFDGALFLSALATYAAARWALEPIRETVDRIGPVSLNRAISASLVALSWVGLLLGWSHKRG
ncbi:MAG TPA: prolipoprotein diacylglyceryl transferase family protein [Bryobacteraceae bacterium]|nr:prolipoprotein diacylglyceryl transferase family protein [Bryobacteraceae bacterium]